MDAARVWSGGGDDGESVKKAASRLGISVKDSIKPEPFELWPENLLAFELLTLAQWLHLVGDKVVRIGIDQASVRGLLDEHPDAPKDKSERWELFNSLIEAGNVCCEAWNQS